MICKHKPSAVVMTTNLKEGEKVGILLTLKCRNSKIFQVYQCLNSSWHIIIMSILHQEAAYPGKSMYKSIKLLLKLWEKFSQFV